MSSIKQDLREAACAVMKHAHAPYSHYHVGAAILADDGNVYVGTNVENAAYPEGWCAETSAIAAMIAGGAKRISKVCVITKSDPPGTPCGGCRQRLSEFSDPDTPVLVANLDGQLQTWRMDELLPGAFKLKDI
jgi:cytidine deaminase